jgi:protein tyrosine/serine phosphatase
MVGLLLLGALSAHAGIPRFNQVTDHIYRGAQPETEADYELLARLGVRTILNLRDDNVAAERAIVERLGMRFVHAPMSGWQYPDTETVRAALAELNSAGSEANPGAVFVHCRLGKDRTGLIVGLYRVHTQGWSRDRAYAEMRAIGFNPVLLGLTAFFWTDETMACSQTLVAGI